MIDQLISSDFGVLAREHRQVPPLDAVMPRANARNVRPTIKLDRWIVRALVGSSAVIAVRGAWFERYPLSAPLIVLAVISLVGLFDTGVRESFARQLGSIITAIALTATASTLFVIDVSTYATLNIDSIGARFYRGPDEPTSSLTAIGVSILALVGGYVLALALRIRQRALQPWSSLAKIASTSMFVVWIALCQSGGRGDQAVRFRLPHWTLQRRLHVQIADAIYNLVWRGERDRYLFDWLSDTQFDFLLVAGGIALLLASIAVAYRSSSKLAAKWLAIAEHVAIAPLGVAFGMVNLVLAVQQCGGGHAALAAAGILVAFTSMTLRRLRRSAGLPGTPRRAAPKPASHPAS